ncbi:hypothetical protein [Sphingopyxis witflariensis]|uniref:hypothetical protein n=1 Tax=Sphingopyxis witflariensis TaxID=173675 RepID=UPI001181873D|nr:hypothetical protein [Sphingopyxis witflariensis]
MFMISAGKFAIGRKFGRQDADILLKGLPPNGVWQAMQDPSTIEQSDYDWQPCSIIFPRIGRFMDRYGVRRRLILPGHYFVRRSRSMGGWIYRRG